MTSTTRVVILVGSLAEPGHLFDSAIGGASPASALSNALGTNVEVTVVSWAPALHPLAGASKAISLASGPQPLIDRILNRTGAHGVKRLLAKYPAGRLFNSLSPTDQSRVFWRAISRNAKAVKHLETAEIVIAADLPAVKTAWTVLHKGLVKRSFVGLPAAITELSR